MENAHVSIFEGFDAVGKKPGVVIAKKRGEEFEKLINDIFESEKILLQRSYRINNGVREQIDGAIKIDGRVVLIEVKWVESGIAASELYSFIGKVDNKFDGTIGLFISRVELSESVILALNKGRRQRILVIHGDDIDLIFDEKLSIGEYLIDVIHEVSIRNDAHLSVKKYLSRQKSSGNIKKASLNTEVVVSNFITEVILDTNLSTINLTLEYGKLNHQEKKEIFEFIINQYPQFYDYSTSSEKGIQFAHPNAVKNANEFLGLYKKDSIEDKVSLSLVKKYYSQLVLESPVYYHRPIFTVFFAPNYQKLDDVSRKSIENMFITKLKEVYGNYDSENQLTDIYEPIWLDFSKETKTRLKKIYLELFVSSRRKGFSQVLFAKYLLDEQFISKDEILEWLVGKVSEDYESYKELGLERPYAHIAENYIMLSKYLDIYELNWSDYVTSLFGK